jgi:hypothetical protein
MLSDKSESRNSDESSPKKGYEAADQSRKPHQLMSHKGASGATRNMSKNTHKLRIFLPRNFMA